MDNVPFKYYYILTIPYVFQARIKLWSFVKGRVGVGVISTREDFCCIEIEVQYLLLLCLIQLGDILMSSKCRSGCGSI